MCAVVKVRMQGPIHRLCILFTVVTLTRASLGLTMPESKSRIIGGDDASYGEFPHHVGLLHGPYRDLFCSGVLIQLDWVLTTAVCCERGKSLDPLVVTVGSLHLYSLDPNQEKIRVEKIKIHEDFNGWSLENDICLLKLTRPARRSSNVDTITLAKSSVSPRTTCYVTGWGVVNIDDPHHYAQVLQKAKVPVISDDECRKINGDMVADSMICAGTNEKDACTGDSGGGLVCPVGGQNARLAGLVSWGYECAGPSGRSVYTEVYKFVQWIEKNLE